MQKFLLATATVAVLMGASSVAHSEHGPFMIGDAPYRLDWGPDPRVDSGCLRWNWQQYQWNDFCAVDVHPKAYMHPRPIRRAVQVRG